MADELINFLVTRLDEDEQAARAAAALCGCHDTAPNWDFGEEETGGRILIANDPHPQPKRKLARYWNRTYQDLFVAQHIARHDPTRVLAEVDAKRKLIAAHVRQEHNDGCVVCDAGNESCGCVSGSHWSYPCDTVKLLALPYANHPDYDEAWRP